MRKTVFFLLTTVFVAFVCGNAGAFETHFPHLTSGSASWDDYFQANNNTSEDAVFTLTLFDDDGDQVYSQEHTVEALSRLAWETKTLEPSASTGMVAYEEEGLNFRISYENVKGGVAEFKTIDELHKVIGLYFSDFTPSVEAKGAAVANFGAAASNVTLYAVGQGDILGTFETNIGPNEKIVGFHSTWFPEVAFERIESIIAATESESLCGIVICADADTSHLLFTPAAPVYHFASEVSEWTFDADIDLGGLFPVRGDAVLTVYAPGDTFLAVLTTSQVGGAAIVDEIRAGGTIDGNVYTIDEQVHHVEFDDFSETNTSSGQLTITGDMFVGSGTITSVMTGLPDPILGSWTVSGTRKTD